MPPRPSTSKRESLEALDESSLDDRQYDVPTSLPNQAHFETLKDDVDPYRYACLASTAPKTMLVDYHLASQPDALHRASSWNPGAYALCMARPESIVGGAPDALRTFPTAETRWSSYGALQRPIAGASGPQASLRGQADATRLAAHAPPLTYALASMNTASDEVVSVGLPGPISVGERSTTAVYSLALSRPDHETPARPRDASQTARRQPDRETQAKVSEAVYSLNLASNLQDHTTASSASVTAAGTGVMDA
jgi:hypothetical protein